MSGFYNKAVDWLGLGDEQSHAPEGYDQPPERQQRPQPGTQRGPNPSQGQRREPRQQQRPPQQERRSDTVRVRALEDSDNVRVRPIENSEVKNRAQQSAPQQPDNRSHPINESRVRAVEVEDQQESLIGTVRPVPMKSTSEPVSIVPRSFGDAQKVADLFKEGKPVLVDLREAERDLARRLIDFCSGLCYGMSGAMERQDGQIYLLTPSAS